MPLNDGSNVIHDVQPMFENIQKLFSLLVRLLYKQRVVRSSYHPVGKIDDKRNFKRYFRIERNGQIVERILLELPTKGQREEIIFKHFLKFLEGDIKKRGAHYEIIGRDNPWDFTVRSSYCEEFHVEITSIADNSWSFEKSTREEEYRTLVSQEKISLRKLKKLTLWFGTKDLENAIYDCLRNGYIDDDMVINPIFNKPVVIFLSDTKEETENLYKLVYSTFYYRKQGSENAR
ncbi:MAG: hypothetical protein Q7S79_00710 [bacterium]|nr:hypothetical protein [bacterium]